jgi:hypothetical protein
MATLLNSCIISVFDFKNTPPLVFRFKNIAVCVFTDFFFDDGLEAEMESSSSTLARLLAAVDQTSIVDMPSAGIYLSVFS